MSADGPNVDVSDNGADAVVLFGSMARGDADQHSDRDLCAFGPNLPLEARVDVRRRVAQFYGGTEQSTCFYSWEDVDTMVEAGSLFLWHIQTEGKILYDPAAVLERRLAMLVPYDRYVDDLGKYRKIFDGVHRDIRAGFTLNECDLHALFLVARNCALLGTMLFQQPCFGRASCISRLRELAGECGLSDKTYEHLVAGHFTYARGIAPSTGRTPPSDDITIAEVGALVTFVEGLVNASGR
jgi:predicted nucleotidyltransferase